MAQESLGERIWYKNWPPKVRKCLDYPDCTLAEFLKETTTKHAAKPAIFFLNAEITYRQLWDMVQRLATALSDLGYKNFVQVRVNQLISTVTPQPPGHGLDPVKGRRS